MATANISPTSGSFSFRGYDGSVYNTARDLVSGDAGYSNNMTIGQLEIVGEYYIYRCGMAFEIPDMSAINSAILHFHGINDQSSTDFYLYLVESTFDVTNNVDNYSVFSGRQTGGSQDTGLVLNESWYSTSYNASGMDITLDANGLSALFAKKGSTFKLFAISSRDYDANAPSGYELLFLDAPELQINYTPISAPTVSTEAVSSIGATSFTGNGTVIDTGGTTVTRRGFCYKVGTSGDPTTSDSVVYDDGSFGTGAFSKLISGLTKGVAYRVRAYATSSAGTGYGTTVSATPVETKTLAGVSNLVFDTVGDMVTIKALVGNCNIVISTDAARLIAERRLSGTAEIKIDTVAKLNATRGLFGNSDSIVSASGLLNGSFSLAGESNSELTAEGFMGIESDTGLITRF